MKIGLSEHFTYGKLLRFTLPSICMMIFSSIYGVVDGFFVSNFAGEVPFAAVNFIMPFLMMLGALGFMFGTGGSALVAKTMGEGDKEKANKIFSLVLYVSIAVGIIVAILGVVFIRPIAKLLGAEGELLENCVIYGRIILVALPAFMLQMEFQSLFVTAEKPKLGLFVTVASGVTNMVLDALLVGVLEGGLIGAAVATAISQAVGGIVPLFYFARPNSSLLRLRKTNFDGKALLKTCTNGSSELLSNVSMSLVGMLYNVQLLKYAGEDGVSAYGVLMYVGFIFLSAFIGYSVGIAPVVGFNFGSGNKKELKGLFKKSLCIISVGAVVMVSSCYAFSAPLSKLFVGYDAELLELTCNAFNVYSFVFLLAGFSIFSSGFFTALNDGLTSAVISFLRTVVFQVGAVLILPMIWGTDGIWWSVVASDAMAVLVSSIFIFAKRKKYGYI
ncbi:MAG: MATE family efflux transporter [Ruminococcaceae bacterium]|nr:MATE family efflux transporter [Oscillospiraceae bacterium]